MKSKESDMNLYYMKNGGKYMKEKVMNFLKLSKEFCLANKSLVMKILAVVIVIIAIIVIAHITNHILFVMFSPHYLPNLNAFAKMQLHH